MRTHPAVLGRREFWLNHLSRIEGPTRLSNAASLQQVRRFGELRESLSRAFGCDLQVADRWWSEFTDNDLAEVEESMFSESDGDDDSDVTDPQVVELEFPERIRLDIEYHPRSLEFWINALDAAPVTKERLDDLLTGLREAATSVTSRKSLAFESFRASRQLLGHINGDALMWRLPALRWGEVLALSSRATGPFATTPSRVLLLLLPAVWPSRTDSAQGYRAAVEQALLETGLVSADDAADYSGVWWDEVSEALPYEWRDVPELGWVTTAEASTRCIGRSEPADLRSINALLSKALNVQDERRE